MTRDFNVTPNRNFKRIVNPAATKMCVFFFPEGNALHKIFVRMLISLVVRVLHSIMKKRTYEKDIIFYRAGLYTDNR
jgi:hypothetical protein